MQEYENARQDIIEAAIELIKERNITPLFGISTNDIARRAGITQPLIHYHFGNRRMLEKIVERELHKRELEE